MKCQWLYNCSPLSETRHGETRKVVEKSRFFGDFFLRSFRMVCERKSDPESLWADKVRGAPALIAARKRHPMTSRNRCFLWGKKSCLEPSPPLRQGNITQKPWICQQEPLANLLQLEPFKKGLDEKMPKRIVRRKAPKVKLGVAASRSLENCQK